MIRPHHVRQSAFDLFQRQVPDLDAGTDALVRAAVAVAKHELADADPERVLGELGRLGGIVASRSASGSPQSRLAHLHHLLFDELGFRGDPDHYHEPRMSYLPLVLERKRGIPITLSLVYKAVAEGAGVAVSGVNAPGHFLVMVEGPDRMLVDPFDGGRMLTREDAFGKIEDATGRAVPREDAFLPVATHRQWLSRIILNLRNIFHRAGRPEDVKAMHELDELL